MMANESTSRRFWRTTDSVVYCWVKWVDSKGPNGPEKQVEWVSVHVGRLATQFGESEPSSVQFEMYIRQTILKLHSAIAVASKTDQ